MIRLADLLISFIAKLNSKKVFVLTGNGAMYINDAIQLSSEIDYVCVRNETVAPLAASAYFQITGNPGIVCVTAGPGAANAIPGVVEAWVENSNVLVISGQVPNFELVGNNDEERKKLKTFGIAGLPITDYVKNFTKLAISFNENSDIEEILTKVYLQFKQGVPGPIWLDIPLDIQSKFVHEIDLDRLIEDANRILSNSKKNQIDATFLKTLSNCLEKSEKPILILGTGAFRGVNSQELISWLVELEIPFGLSRPVAHKIPLMIKGNLGVLGVRGRPWSKYILENSDLVIGIGTRFPSSLVGPSFNYLNSSSKLLLINNNELEIKRNRDRIENSSTNHSHDFFTSKEIKNKFLKYSRLRRDWLNSTQEIKASRFIQSVNFSDDFLDIYWLCEQIDKQLSRNHILTTDAGSNYYACGQSMTFNSSFREVTSGTFAAMGVSLPYAIGCAVSDENKEKIICVTGDGSIELNIQELLTVVNYSLNIAIFVINNGGYASMRTWQDKFFESRYIGSTDETGAKPMNFKSISAAFGIPYTLIQSEHDFINKMPMILDSVGPMLVEVICNPNQIMQLPMEQDLV